MEMTKTGEEQGKGQVKNITDAIHLIQVGESQQQIDAARSIKMPFHLKKSQDLPIYNYLLTITSVYLIHDHCLWCVLPRTVKTLHFFP